MKKSRFTDSQIIAVLKQVEGGMPVAEVLRSAGISSATFYKWRAKFGGMDASMVSRMKELEDENRRLKSRPCKIHRAAANSQFDPIRVAGNRQRSDAAAAHRGGSLPAAIARH